jgi:enoyl-CoA hydratase/carnithine racemase
MSIQVSDDAGILRVVLDRPERRNALSLEMYQGLTRAFESVSDNPSVRAVVLLGRPDIFCAGNDIQDFLDVPLSQSGPVIAGFMRAVMTCPVPVVAGVNGAAVGIGTTLLWHCDLVYAADNAMFSMPFVNLGLCPEFGASWLTPLAAGYHRAAEKLLLGEPMTAEDAVEMRLVNRLLPPSDVAAHAVRQAAKFCRIDAAAVRESKRLLKASLLPTLEQTIDAELAAFGRLLEGEAAQLALRAFAGRT